MSTPSIGLVVDDEPDARETVRRLLEDAGAEILAVGSVSKALTKLRLHKPDLVVSDIGMPEQSGCAMPARRGGKVPAIAPARGTNDKKVAIIIPF